MPPKNGGNGSRLPRRNHSLDTRVQSRTTTTTTTKPSIASQAGKNRLAIKSTQSGFNIAPLILEGVKLNKMELNDVIKQKFGGVTIRDIQGSRTGIFTIQASDVQSFNKLLNELQATMISNGHGSAKVFVPRSIQRIKDTEKVAFVKRVDTEIPEDRIVEAIRSIGIDVTNVARLLGKDGKTASRTLKITFGDVCNRNTFVRNGLQVDYMHFDAEPASQNTKPIQCFLCLKFNHVAKYCRTKEQICAKCGENHRKDQCTVTDDQIKCVNCKGKHEATSQDCTFYQDQEKKMKQQVERFSSSQRSTNTTPVFDVNEFPHLPKSQRQWQDNLPKDFFEEIVNALSTKMENLIEKTTTKLFAKLKQRIQMIEQSLGLSSCSQGNTNINNEVDNPIDNYTNNNNNQDEEEFISELSSEEEENFVAKSTKDKRQQRRKVQQQPQPTDVTPKPTQNTTALSTKPKPKKQKPDNSKRARSPNSSIEVPTLDT